VPTLNNVRVLELELAQIQQDLVELFDNAGQEYTEAEVQTAAWEQLFNRHPQFTPNEAWNG
jgi:hypothetical protein